MGVILPDPSGNNAGHDLAGGNKLIAFEILSVILQLLSIIFNGAIICTLLRRSLLKYPSNRFVFSLCISHLFVSFLGVSISVITTFLPFSPSFQPVFQVSQQHHGANSFHTSQKHGSVLNTPFVEEAGKTVFPVQCTESHNTGVDLAQLIMMHMNFGVAVCTSITVALISAERYITIARPMRYKSIVTARRSLYAIICCWLLAALITMMPLLLFENRDPVCGTFSVPMGSLATYFGVVFAVVTVFALAVMIVCYAHIFRIAKAKCQKVQIGHFTASTVSSISSDWPSSVYSSVQGPHRFLHPGSRIESSNSLLHWVLLSNLGRHNQPMRVPNMLRGGIPLTPPATPTLPPKTAFFSESALNSRRESDETTTTGTSGSRNGSASSSSSGNGPNGYFIDPSRSHLYQYHHLPVRKTRNRWRTYFQPNYNSPRKTIFTIMLLIGAVLFTQLPLSFVLFTSTVETTQRWFQFCISVLFSTSSVANPVLYGFLNRSIRDQLWRLLRRKSHIDHGPSASSIRKRKRGQQQRLEEMAQTSKGFLSSNSHHHLQELCGAPARAVVTMEIPAIKVSRKESISSDDNSSAHSVASTSSVNTIDRNSISCNTGSAKGKFNQVQKRMAAASSPYYRTVLLKKANSITRKASLFPRLALPDVNVRRNSSGSIISIRTNGVLSSMKEKFNENDEEGCDDNDSKYAVEMQTFKNYSTPDLQSSTPIAVQVHTESEEACQKNTDNGGNEDSIEISSQNNVEGQEQVSEETDKCKNVIKQQEESPREVCSASGNASASVVLSADPLETQPGSSRGVMEENRENCNNAKLVSRMSVESLMGVVIDGELLPENFPRKPSQDSGADMSFSDEEDDIPSASTVNGQQLSSPVLLSTPSLASLPATLTVMLKTVEDVRDGVDERFTTSTSTKSLVGPLLFIEHPETSENLQRNTLSQSVLYLPCSCRNSRENVNDMIGNDCVNSANEKEESSEGNGNSVTVTITESNNDKSYTSHEVLNSNKRLLQVENLHYHRHHHPECLNSYKSKSESDIVCSTNRSRIKCQHHDDGVGVTDLRVRSNCHIDYLIVGANDKSNHSSSLPGPNNRSSISDLSSAFTLFRTSSQNSCLKTQAGDPCCSVWLNDAQLPLLSSSMSENNANQVPFAGILSSQSPQWLSVMSMHSSCSSLSSTCPLRILEGNNKSDISDYDDFEDHIEI